ncbi:MAG: preprotein translocase subunit SecG [Candidatus Hydrothermae bacterium]|nr:preprotein translocase subunit SecG [Candidatus Hydrothermae bacterium]
MLTTLLLILYVFVVVLMILAILIQEPKEGGLSGTFGGGGVQNVLGVREAPTFFTKLTVGLGILYAVMSLTLSLMNRPSQNQPAILQEIQRIQELQIPENAPASPTAQEPSGTESQPTPSPLFPEGTAPNGGS